MTFSTITCTIITALYLYQHDVSPYELLHLFGLWPVSVSDVARGMLLVCILFAGPLYENGIVDGDWKGWIRLRGLHETLSSWIGYRNFVVVCDLPYNRAEVSWPCQKLSQFRTAAPRIALQLTRIRAIMQHVQTSQSC